MCSCVSSVMGNTHATDPSVIKRTQETPLAAMGQALPILALLTNFQGEAFTTYD